MQPRKNLDTEKQRHLTASVRRLGILQPISVRFIEAENTYQLISGERRYHAAKEAGLTEIPCWVQNPKNEEILLRQIVENWQRADLEPMELAGSLAVLRDANRWSQKDLADHTGKPESEISRLLSLFKLQPEVQAQVKEAPKGVFTKRHLTAIARVPQEDQQEVMIDVKRRNLTATETERKVQEHRAVTRGTEARGRPPAHVRRFFAANAVVTLTFRRKHVTDEDLVEAIDEVRAQLTEGTQAAKDS